jgi:hypothetical protein
LTYFIPLKKYYIGIDDEGYMVPMVSRPEEAWFVQRNLEPKLKWMKDEEAQKYNYHLEFEDSTIAVEYVLVWR